MSKYVLENEAEFERLEKQSQDESYDYKSELSGFLPKPIGAILDAGCGSGVVSRYLAHQYPLAAVTGCDFSDLRVAQAKKHAQNISNLHFETQDLAKSTFDSSSFDAIVCRFVLEHLKEKEISQAVSELYRCLRPNGIIRVIDIDGLLFNLFPQTELVQKVLYKIANEKQIDLQIGRKIPSLLKTAGFSNIHWQIETLSFQGEKLKSEIELNRERMAGAFPFFKNLLGSEQSAKQFISEFFDCLHAPEAVLFYNKFIVSGEKIGLNTKRSASR